MVYLKTAIGLEMMREEVTMNKKILLVLSMLHLFLTLSAQKVQLPSFALKANYNERMFVGLKCGINIPRLYYTNEHLQDLPHNFIISPSVGAFIEVPFSTVLSVAPELNYQQRGGATSYLYEQYYHVSYQLNAHYISVRFPLNCYAPIHPSFRPYLFMGPDMGYVIAGRISLSQPGLEIPGSEVVINNSNVNRVYIGALCGAGLRFNVELPQITLVIKTDAALNWGLIDTFSKADHDDTATPTNINAYYIHDKRLSRGLEIHLSVGYVPNKKDDICDHFGYFRNTYIDYK